MAWLRRRYKQYRELNPDEVLLDARNLPSFNTQQFEGRLEAPIKKTSFYLLGLVSLVVGLLFVGKLVDLQVFRGEALALRSVNNTLRQIPIFAERGIIEDRQGEELAWNDPELGRVYLAKPGLAHLLGYVGYPNEEELSTGQFHPEQMVGREGLESDMNQWLQGEGGIKIEEVDVHGQITSEHIQKEPESGHHLKLSIDAGVQSKLYEALTNLMTEYGFQGGAGVIMDVQTGELLALTSAPEFDPNILAKGKDRASINRFLSDKREPFLNRALQGLYTPGSIVKPIMAAAALSEKLINPDKQIYSSGEITVVSPYDPSVKSVFKDWKAHGWVDLRRALALSSNVYFYAIGGGYEGQKGLGIRLIDKYARAFGLGQETGFEFGQEEAGNIPTPEWKADNFDGEPWRLGDTYHTVIGQYGFQVTPLQVVRAVAGLATGSLVKPTLLLDAKPERNPITEVTAENLAIVREGLRLAVTEGTAKGVDLAAVALAAKTGTAELGVSKADVNSWSIGFWPYESPRYAYAVVLEKGSRNNLVGATFAIRQVLDWIVINRPEYLP